MSLVQKLPSGPLDIIGDIHGEYDALCNLLRHLGYDENGGHNDGRSLVFVGDFCDRGPDSPAVLALLEHLVRSGRAVAVLGNHEMNLLRGSAKDGAGWFFDERLARDDSKYAPFKRLDATKKADTIKFLASLPVALEREDLRVVHAAWIAGHIDGIRHLAIGSIMENDRRLDADTQQLCQDLKLQMQAELHAHSPGLEDPDSSPPFMHAHAAYDVLMQMHNPLRVLTSGVESKWHEPFYSGGKWRFVGRVQWWNEYKGQLPVVVGHYWRRFNAFDRGHVGKGGEDLFENTSPLAWHGADGNVFCVDFSVGGRWSARKNKDFPESDCKLAALQWPERLLCFDDGQVMQTTAFKTIAPAI